VAPVAIGDVRPTDVLVLSLDRVALKGAIIPTARSILPAGLAAMWSFAEVWRRGCQAALDVQPDELQVGLQPARASDLRTHRVFIADALENGAGYAPQLGREENLHLVLNDILDDLGSKYDDPDHQICTESCPDCLRSYDNRRLHGALDWRLALDVAALAAGRGLDLSRWMRRAEPLAAGFIKAYGALPCEAIEVGEGLMAIVRRDRKRGVVIGHPLWRHEEQDFNDAQAVAFDQMLTDEGVISGEMSDVWVLQRLPARLFSLLSDDS
jgi:DEAD/DEAH box helicase domain-containing protein